VRVEERRLSSQPLGSATSSPSIRASSGARAMRSARLSAGVCPARGCRTTVSRGSVHRASVAPVWSVDPSSTTMSSKSAKVWAVTLATASAIHGSQL
jgi:hypothetical protein